jgi:hypothetical protein
MDKINTLGYLTIRRAEETGREERKGRSEWRTGRLLD